MSAVPISSLPPRKSFAQARLCFVAAAAHQPLIVKESHPVASAANNQASATTNDARTHKVTPSVETELSTRLPDTAQTPVERHETAVVTAEADAPDTGQLAQPLSVDGLVKRENSDTKSVASRTTLTIDEKESLRPDDSASVQAGIDDDSPPGSRVGSNPEARAFRDQLHEIERTGQPRFVAQRAAQPPPAPRSLPHSGGGIIYAGSVAPPIQPPPQTEIPAITGGPPSGLALPPDDKLLEALASPKDRLFVLKIEQDIIDFVKDSKENFLQLPQTNSFYRMLSHKLADYYCLSHVVDETMTSVRIYRTPHCRLPPPLIGDPTAEGSTPPPQQQARKIMRRGDEGTGPHTGDSTHNHSKAGSELGDDKDKGLTREERETRYNEARARIFKDFNEGSTKETETASPKDPPHSRSSSQSGVQKSKKKRRQPRDDTFEARSAYNQYGHQAYSNNSQFPSQDQFYQAFAQMNVSGQYPPQHGQAAMTPGDPHAVHAGQMLPQQTHQSQWYPYQQQQQLQQVYGMYPSMSQPNVFAAANATPQAFQAFPAAYHQYGQTPSANPQTTPRPGSAAPATFQPPGFPSPQPQTGMWPGQQQFQGGYACQPGFHGFQGSPTQPHTSHLPGAFGYPAGQQDGQAFYAAPGQGSYGQQFNAQSQPFYPPMTGGMMPSNVYAQGQMYPGSPTPYGAMRPAMQMSRQQSATSHVSGYGSPRPMHQASPGRAPPPPHRGAQPGKMAQWQQPGGAYPPKAPGASATGYPTAPGGVKPPGTPSGAPAPNPAGPVS